MVTFNIRMTGGATGAIYCYIWSSVNGTVLGDTGYAENVYNKNGAKALRVVPGEQIAIRVWGTESGAMVVGASDAWVGATITVVG